MCSCSFCSGLRLSLPAIGEPTAGSGSQELRPYSPGITYSTSILTLRGVPRCIFGNFEGYKRAMEIANSPNVGICLCCGTWLEGGKELTGKDPEEMIRYFGAAKIWKIHFRNVSAPLPHFVETFMDNGYYDMYKIMKALRDVNYDGIVIPDHIPSMVGQRSGLAYCIAYMRALRDRANREAQG